MSGAYFAPKDAEIHGKVYIWHEIAQIRLDINETVTKLENPPILHCKTGFSSLKFCILGTFGLGPNIWVFGIPRHQVIWERCQKVSIGLLVLNYHFSL